MARKIIILICLLLQINALAIGTSYHVEFKTALKNYNSYNYGLSTNYYYRVYQDPQGFFWFASDNGLVHFDGSSFKVVSGTEGMDIVSWFIQDKNYIWLFDYNGLLKGYNLLTRTLDNYGRPSKSSDEWIRVRPFVMGIELGNDLYFTKFRDSETIVIDKKNKSIMHIENFEAFQSKVYKHFGIAGLDPTHDQQIYPNANFSIPEGGQAIIVSGKIFELIKPGMSRLVFSGKNHGGIQNITHYARKGDDLYISIWNKGLVRYNHYFIDPFTTSTDTLLNNDRISNFIFDSADQLWVTTTSEGIFKINSSLGGIQKLNYPIFTGNIEPISSIHQLGHYLLFFIKNTHKYIKFNTLDSTIEYAQEDGLSHSEYSKILETPLGNYGVFQSGIYKLIEKGNQIQFLPVESYPTNAFIARDAAFVNDIIYVANRNTFLEIKLTNDTIIHKAFENKNLATFVHHAHDEFIIGTSNGLFLNDRKLPILEDEIIRKIIKLNGIYLVATQRGLYKLWHENNQWLTLKMSNENYHKLVSNNQYVFCLGQSRFSAYRLSDGKELFCIQSDEFPTPTNLNDIHIHHNSLYIGTNNGVYCLDMEYLKNLKIQSPRAYVTLNNIIHHPDSLQKFLYNADLNYELSLNAINILDQKFQTYYEILKDGKIWIPKRLLSDKNNQIHFKGLEPGFYQIKYYLESPWQGWDNTVKYEFLVEKNWWQKTWFIVLAAIGIVLILTVIFYVIFKKYQLNLKRKAALEQRLFELESVSILSQLKPHFIFNALLPIQHYLFNYDRQKGLTYLDKFSQLMRSLLEGIRERNIVLEKEINFIQNYLYLQKERFNHSFDYEINIGEDVNIYTTLIPNMILQPIIENAVEHGMEAKEGNGLITIDIEANGSTLEIYVKDNGKGFDTDKLFKPNHAITIIQEHLDLLNKKTGIGKFVYKSIIGKGSTFKIEVPLITKKNN